AWRNDAARVHHPLSAAESPARLDLRNAGWKVGAVSDCDGELMTFARESSPEARVVSRCEAQSLGCGVRSLECLTVGLLPRLSSLGVGIFLSKAFRWRKRNRQTIFVLATTGQIR